MSESLFMYLGGFIMGGGVVLSAQLCRRLLLQCRTYPDDFEIPKHPEALIRRTARMMKRNQNG